MTEQLKAEIKAIRVELRLAMNGIISTSMREKGMVYKLNFGVPLLEVRQIAAKFKPSSELAEALWKEDIREFKLLAPLLQPVNEFSEAKAIDWVKTTPYVEIAEQCSRYLFAKLPEADKLAVDLLSLQDMPFAITTAYAIFAQWLIDGHTPEDRELTCFMDQAKILLTQYADHSWADRLAIVSALRYYGRQSPEKGEKVLKLLGAFEADQDPVLQEIYNELKFEFEYWH